MVSLLVGYVLLGILITSVFEHFDSEPQWECAEFCTCCLLWPLGLLLVVCAFIRRELW
jgi:hypothetical protein